MIKINRGGNTMRFALKTKIRVIIVLVVLVCSLAYMSLAFFVIQRAVSVQMRNDGQTLVTTIKRELIKNNVIELTDMQEIFKEIKQASNENISYVSLSDTNSNILLTDEEIFAQSGEQTDAVSSATVGGDVEEIIQNETTSGDFLTMSDGTKVYNISTQYQYNEEIYSLNIGISLLTMNQEIKYAMFDMAIIGIIIIVVAILVAVIPATKIIKPILTMSKDLNLYAKGDFSKSTLVNSKDEMEDMSKALNEMRLNMVQLVSGIQNSSGQVLESITGLHTAMEESTKSAKEISKVSDDLTIGAEELAQNSQNGLSKMNMLADRINSLYHSIDVVQEGMNHIQSASSKGSICQNELNHQMDDNKTIFTQTKEKLDELSDKMSSITQMTTIVKSIADQTTLLALNARIESARAGEQGQGFAVVAQEIGQLADQTTKSIDGIENVTTEVEVAFKTTVELMEKGLEVVKHTTNASIETGDSFVGIEKAINDILRYLEVMVGDIKKVHISKEDAIHLMENISLVAQQSSSAIEEIAASMESQNEGLDNIAQSTRQLQSISGELDDLISRFNL